MLLLFVVLVWVINYIFYNVLKANIRIFICFFNLFDLFLVTHWHLKMCHVSRNVSFSCIEV